VRSDRDLPDRQLGPHLQHVTHPLGPLPQLPLLRALACSQVTGTAGPACGIRPLFLVRAVPVPVAVMACTPLALVAVIAVMGATLGPIEVGS